MSSNRSGIPGSQNPDHSVGTSGACLLSSFAYVTAVATTLNLSQPTALAAKIAIRNYSRPRWQQRSLGFPRDLDYRRAMVYFGTFYPPLYPLRYGRLRSRLCDYTGIQQSPNQFRQRNPQLGGTHLPPALLLVATSHANHSHLDRVQKRSYNA